MDSLLNKSVFKYQINTRSKISYNGRTNCCFISSFQSQMKAQWNDFVSLDHLLNWIYPNTTNAYTHFANDFPAKWFKIRKIIELNDKNKIWKSRFDQIVLGIYLPLVNNSSCVVLTFIDLNQIIPDEVSVGNYKSLEKSFSDVLPPGKIPINIIQLLNHFEPIQINEYVGKLEDIEQVANKDFLD